MSDIKFTPYQRAAKGIAYREHPTRKHGKRADRYYVLVFKQGGKSVREAVGWASDGVTQDACEKLLVQLRDNWRSGSGPQSLAELRSDRQEAAEAKKIEQRAAAKANVTFSEFWEAEYFPAAEATRARINVESERAYYSKWIAPAIGDIPLQKIDAAKVEALAVKIQKAGKSPGTVAKILGILSQVWHKAAARDIVKGESPTRRVKKPKRDNRRARFLSHDEARTLLSALEFRSKSVHDEALLALFCGLRAGEIFNLTVADIDFDAKTIFLRDTKSGKNRYAYMTVEVEDMLRGRVESKGQYEKIFPAVGGGVRQWVSQTFDRVVAELGFNEGIEDARQRVVFHTLRHTFASWLVQRGTSIYEVAKLMGHSTIRMTERYSHLAPDTVRRAAMGLEGILAQKKAKVLPFIKGEA